MPTLAHASAPQQVAGSRTPRNTVTTAVGTREATCVLAPSRFRALEDRRGPARCPRGPPFRQIECPCQPGQPRPQAHPVSPRRPERLPGVPLSLPGVPLSLHPPPGHRLPPTGPHSTRASAGRHPARPRHPHPACRSLLLLLQHVTTRHMASNTTLTISHAWRSGVRRGLAALRPRHRPGQLPPEAPGGMNLLPGLLSF